MIFSKSCEYALRAVIYIYMKSSLENKISVTDISKEINSPIPFTSKIMQQLTRKKIVLSVKGPNGGFYINDSVKLITVYQVVEAIDGIEFFDRCIIGLENCNENNPCPLHLNFKQYRLGLRDFFMSKTIQDLISEKNGKINLR